MKIQIVVFDGVDETDFIGPHEIFHRAAKIVGGVDVALVTLEPRAEITAAFGLRFVPDQILDGQADLVVIPGGGWATHSTNSVRAEINRGLLTREIAALHARGTTLAGVCTGAMALAAAGLLTNRPSITHHAALQDLRSAGASVINARVVDDGDIVTCGGVSSSLDLALWLVERFWGTQTSNRIAAGMEYSRTADIFVARYSQNIPGA